MPLFSANCHLIEPGNMFEGRMARKWADRAPRLIDGEDGGQAWVFEDIYRPLYRVCAVSGTPKDTWTGNSTSTTRIDALRPGHYDAASRLKDMDLDGVDVAAVSSSPASMGFNYDLFGRVADPELGNETMRAWNDWYFEEWISVSPERFVPIGATSYFSPEDAAREVYRNAERGFKGVAFRNPVDFGRHWVGTGHWDPFFHACVETQTVLYHHTEYLGFWPKNLGPELTPYPYGLGSTLFQSQALEFVNSMMWGGVPVRFPDLRIMVAESGGSWIPHLLKHMTWATEFSFFTSKGWPDPDLKPVDMLRRSFRFSTLELDEAIRLEDEYGIGGWMIEDDFPHVESIWPNTEKHFGETLQSLDRDRFEALAWRNASELFRHPMPPGGYIDRQAQAAA